MLLSESIQSSVMLHGAELEPGARIDWAGAHFESKLWRAEAGLCRSRELYRGRVEGGVRLTGLPISCELASPALTPDRNSIS